MGAMEEVQINTAAHSAEASTPGVQSQFISKSGGNQYRGTFFGGYSHESWQSFNINQDQIDRGLQGGGGLRPEDVNRLWSYQDENVGFGGYIGKDRLWWYGSYRHQDIKARFVNFPVKPQTTILNNYSVKLTYNLSQNHKLIGYTQPSQKKQPQRFDSFLLGVDTGINTSEETTWNQNFWAWVHKVEWNAVLSDNAFVGGTRWPVWLRLDQRRERHRPALRGHRQQPHLRAQSELGPRTAARPGAWMISAFKDGWAGNHNFKAGGEIFDETVVDIYVDGYEEDILHVMQNGAKLDIILFQAPNEAIGGLRTYGTFLTDTWRLNNRLTATVGLRFDRYRAFLPAQEHAAGRFNPAPITFSAQDNVVTFNLFAPRLGMTYDVQGNGRTVLKFNYGKYWFNPGADFVFNVSENAPAWWRRYRWNDLNSNNRWDPGEEGALRSSRGGVATESMDPNLEDTRTDEIAAFLEREIMPNFGVRAGYVWRGLRNQYQRVNTNQPFSAFTVPVSVPDPGPDGRAGTADDGPPISALDLAQEFRGRTPVNMTTNVPGGEAGYHTIEITGTKRMSNRWSLLASWGFTKSFDNGNSAYQGNAVRGNSLPANPQQFSINTDEGRHVYTRHNAKLSGTLQTPWWRFPSHRCCGISRDSHLAARLRPI